ncbi:MAG: MerR family transcriptional regulator [Clostridia bacterium]|nr:MerR family transcriptional regulator [Deltaproteobacteria bacterium]
MSMSPGTVATRSPGSLRVGKQGPDSPIPDKLYFKIGEVSALVGVRAHVLRYWEKEVPMVRPGKSVSNQRRYRYRDVEIFREIRRLLQDERYTLAGAKKRIMSGEEDMPSFSPDEHGLVSATAKPVKADVIFDALPAHLSLGLALSLPQERLERVREGLRDVIRLVGEEP